jgi:L-fuculose-phosphate aldolase
MRHISLRRSVLETAKRMSALGLSRGTSGNVSARTPDGLVITPSGLSYDELSIEDMVEMDVDGHVPGISRKPSSEWRIHADLYRTRSDVGAIVHAHPMFCTTMSILRREIPAVHYMIALAGGGTVPCAPYRTFGTPELSEVTLQALQGRKACLLANHGMVAVGKDLRIALKVAHEIETVAEQYWRALQVGQPVVLDDKEVGVILGKLETYGQQSEG